VIAKRYIALGTTIAVVALALVALVVRSVAAHRAYARAEAFCAATPPGTPAREVTIRALDQSVQVRTDIEPGALVVRFEAWGLSSAVGECRMTLAADRIVGNRVVRVD
jgi:hypothetical protein